MKTLLVLCLAALAGAAQTPPAAGPAPAPAAAAAEPPDPNAPLDETPPPEVRKARSGRKKITAPPPPGQPADVQVDGGANGDDAGGFGATFVGAAGARPDFFRSDLASGHAVKAARSVAIAPRQPAPNTIPTADD